MVEHYLDMVVAAGSSPVVATIITQLLIMTPILVLIFVGFDFYQTILKGIKRASNNALIALQNYNTNLF